MGAGIDASCGCPRSRRVRAAVGVAACIALVVAACGGQPPSSPPASGASTPPGTELPSTAPSRPLTIAWAPVDLPVGGRIQRAGGVNGGPAGGLVLVTIGEEDVEGTAILVPAPTGWRLATADPPFGSAVLVALEDAYLALETTDAEVATVWVSTDGATWARAAGRGMFRNPMRAAAAGGTVVACGQAPEEEACVVSHDRGTSWDWTDPVPDGGWTKALTPFRSGIYALGSDASGRRQTSWTGDGEHWEIRPAQPSMAGVRAVTGFGGVLVGAGSQAQRRYPDRMLATLSASADGRDATRVPLPEIGSRMFDVLRVGDALVAIGGRAERHAWLLTDLLVSSDGGTWRGDALPEALRDAEADVVAAGGRLLAVPIGEGGGPALEGRIADAPDAGPPLLPVPTPAPDPVDPAPALTWSQVGTFDGMPRDVAWTPGRTVVVGVGNDEGEPTAWTSADGRAWEATILPMREPYCTALAVATSPQGTIAAGACVPREDGDGPRTAAFWRSSGGATWEQAPARAEHDLGGQDLDGPELGIVGVAAGAGRFVAVASTADGAVFLSDNGLDWRAGPRLGGVPAGVAWAGDAFVAVGRARGSDRGMAWWSPDGDAWTAVPLDSGAPGAVAAGDRLVVAVGRGPLAWTSPDGRAWTWVPDQSTLEEGDMAAVAIGGHGVSTAGRATCPDGTACLVAWRSADGAAWSRTPLPLTRPGDEIAGIADDGSRIIVVAFDEMRGENAMPGAVVWEGTAD